MASPSAPSASASLTDATTHPNGPDHSHEYREPSRIDAITANITTTPRHRGRAYTVEGRISAAGLGNSPVNPIRPHTTITQPLSQGLAPRVDHASSTYHAETSQTIATTELSGAFVPSYRNPENQADLPSFSSLALDDQQQRQSRELRPPVYSNQILSSNMSRPLTTAPQQGGGRPPSEYALPRWQPDAEVTYCPICNTQFSMWVRKHHCRKCGRVVCSSCSPHRIIIPHQYIVRPPGSEVPIPQNLLMDSLGVGYFDVNGLCGGERVRLCNPCVPDPNTAPPQSASTSTTPSVLSPRNSHQRSRSSISNTYGGTSPPSLRYGVVFPGASSHDPLRGYVPRTRPVVNPLESAMAANSSSRHGMPSRARHPPQNRLPAIRSTSYPHRHSSLSEASSSSLHRRLPSTPQIAEEDECPICHHELPSRSLPNFEDLRTSHINMCIQAHSTYGSPRRVHADEGGAPPPAPRRTGMYAYPATEKDCIDDAECTICLEEFTTGVQMARLECLCRFHRSCIAAWFVNHPGRCPVHQHDGFGY